MKGSKVTHVKYGAGKIVEVLDGYILVSFKGSEEKRRFQYPEAFGQFLTFDDEKLQEEAKTRLLIVEQNKKEEQAGILAKHAELEAIRAAEKAETLKKKRKEAKAKADREKKRIQKLKETEDE